MPGLMRYLFGPGKAEEHTDQRIVAGSSTVMSEWAVTQGAELVDVDAWLFDEGLLPAEFVSERAQVQSPQRGHLSVGEASAMGRMMEGVWRTQTITTMAGAGAPGEALPGISAATRYGSPESPHVYHVTFSLSPDEGSYTDEQWGQLAQEYVRQMGFVSESSQDSCEWAAVHHGVSAKGNDHIHLAVNLVRPTGQRAVLSYTDPQARKTIGDKAQTQLVRRSLEETFEFVRPLSAVGLDAPGHAVASYSKAEARRGAERAQAGAGHSDADRVMLQRAVRGAAIAARTEAHFVSTLREAGVVVYPRFAKGSREQVTGYSYALAEVAQRADAPGSDASFRIGGRNLGADLSVSALRGRWAGNESDRSREALQALWLDPDTRLSVRSPSVTRELESAREALDRWNSDLESRDPHDREAWVRPSEHVAAIVGTVAERAGGAPELQGMRTASRQLANALRRDQLAPRSSGPAEPDAAIAGRHVALAMRAGGLSSSRGWYAVLQQLARTVRAVEQARAVRGEGFVATQVPVEVFPAVLRWVDEHALTDEARAAQASVAHGGRASRSQDVTGPAAVTPHRTCRAEEQGTDLDL